MRGTVHVCSWRGAPSSVLPVVSHIKLHIPCPRFPCAEGVLGTVYLDLVRRPHKFPSAAHFTLRCSRRLANGSYQVRVLHLRTE